jgi:demethylspheroidene O-methyltransferase
VTAGEAGRLATGSWHRFRDRLLASPRFQRWAAAFPLTRPIARRRARALFDLCAGFVYSQVLFACVRLRLLEILAEGPQTAAVLAGRLALPVDGLARLLGAAAALGLVERHARSRFGLGPLGAALLGNPGVAAMVAHHDRLYADLADPVGLLRGERRETALGGYWPYAAADRPGGLGADAVGPYSALMAASQPLVAGHILDAYDFSRHRRLLDVGGGEGVFLAAVAERVPRLELVLFDLPAVAAAARERWARHDRAAGLEGRVAAVGGDFLSEPLPQGADVVSLVRVLHDHDDDTVVALLRRIRAVLPADGTLVVAEPMAGDGPDPVADAYFGFYLLAMGRGRARTPGELALLLRAAGFAPPRPVATHMPMLVRILVSQPLHE